MTDIVNKSSLEPNNEASKEEMLIMYDSNAVVEKRLEIFSKQETNKDLLICLLLSESNEKDEDFKAQAIAMYFVKGGLLTVGDLIYLLKEEENILSLDVKQKLVMLASTHLTKKEKDTVVAFIHEMAGDKIESEECEDECEDENCTDEHCTDEHCTDEHCTHDHKKNSNV